MHCPVNSFSVSSVQMTSYVLFCFIWFWDGRVAFPCGLAIILAWYLRHFRWIVNNWKLTSWKTWLHVVKLRNSTRRKQMLNWFLNFFRIDQLIYIILLSSVLCQARINYALQRQKHNNYRIKINLNRNRKQKKWCTVQSKDYY